MEKKTEKEETKDECKKKKIKTVTLQKKRYKELMVVKRKEVTKKREWK